MNVRTCFKTRRLKWRWFLLALAAIGGTATAAEVVYFPEDMPLPLYAIGLGHSGESEGDWVVTAFCYPPDSFKASYDLSQQPIDPSMVAGQTCYLEGFGLFADGPVPIQSVLKNARGAKVPIWFTPVSAWNGKWTVAQMKKQGSLRGLADFFQDIQQPADPADPDSPMHGLSVASGVLEDGRSFYVRSEVVWIKGDIKDVQYNVDVRFGN